MTIIEHDISLSSSLSFDKIIKNISNLTEQIELSSEQIKSICRKPQGETTFNYLKDNYKNLKTFLNGRMDLLFKMANHRSGHVSLKAFLDNYNFLIPYFTSEQIASMATAVGGICNLEAVRENLERLNSKDFKFSKEEITNIAKDQGGGGKIRDLVLNYDNLFKYKTKGEIYKYYKKSGRRRADLFLGMSLDTNDVDNKIDSKSNMVTDDTSSNDTISTNLETKVSEIGLFSKKANKKRKEPDNYNESLKRKRRAPKHLNDYVSESTEIELNEKASKYIRSTRKFTDESVLRDDAARRTAEYSLVPEDLSTVSTKQENSSVEFLNMSIIAKDEKVKDELGTDKIDFDSFDLFTDLDYLDDNYFINKA